MIVTFEPERVLVLKSVAPKNAPDFIKAICETGWSVLRLEPLTPTSTKITITGMGYREGELYDKAYEFFEKGNAWSLQKMQEAFEPADREAKASAIRKRFDSMVGDWEFSQTTSDGGVFRGKTHVTPLFDGRVYFATGFLGNEKTMARHSHFTAAVDPRSGEWTVWNFDQDGTFTLAPVRLEGNTMTLDWNSYPLSENSAMIPYQVKYTFLDDGTYDVQVLATPNPDGTRNTIAKVHYVRPENTGTPTRCSADRACTSPPRRASTRRCASSRWSAKISRPSSAGASSSFRVWISRVLKPARAARHSAGAVNITAT